jgi:hypothetical protein
MKERIKEKMCPRYTGKVKKEYLGMMTASSLVECDGRDRDTN